MLCENINSGSFATWSARFLQRWRKRVNMAKIDQDATNLKVADWVIIAIYFLGCIIVGLWVSEVDCFCGRRREKAHSPDSLGNCTSLTTVCWNICQRGLCKSMNFVKACLWIPYLLSTTKYHSIWLLKSPGNVIYSVRNVLLNIYREFYRPQALCKGFIKSPYDSVFNPFKKRCE